MVKKTLLFVFSVLITIATANVSADQALAPRDAELRKAIGTLRNSADDGARRNEATSYLEQISRRFPSDPYVSVQLANAYGIQAKFSTTRESKAVWAAKADALLNDVIASHPKYLLATAMRGVHMAMSPPALGYEKQAEKELRRVIDARPDSNTEDDTEAVVASYLFLARLYDRQAKSLSGEEQTEKRRAAEKLRMDLKTRFPKLDLGKEIASQ